MSPLIHADSLGKGFISPATGTGWFVSGKSANNLIMIFVAEPHSTLVHLEIVGAKITF